MYFFAAPGDLTEFAAHGELANSLAASQEEAREAGEKAERRRRRLLMS
ncbi:MAG TPA: hypothetical protein VLM11_19395 [Streptosporangiaceae bacterium]|nr:hypothetical protein [Streptosporangiaceae bacterium]